MAQPAYLSPRPNANPLQHRRRTTERYPNPSRPSQVPLTPTSQQNPRSRRHTAHTPHYASSTSSSTGRKRARNHDDVAAISRASYATPRSQERVEWTTTSTANTMLSGLESPEPFVNTRYNLAGGLDTPGVAREEYFEKLGQEDFVVRRRWTRPGGFTGGDEDLMRQPYNEVARRRSNPPNGTPNKQSWGSFIVGVAEKMWSFGSSAFKGFYAGGGQGYSMSPGQGDEHSMTEESIWSSTQLARSFDRETTPLPGSFPQDDERGDFGDRPAKRMHVEGESPWIMVRDPLEEEMERRSALHQPPPPASQSNRLSTNRNRPSLIPVSRRSTSNVHLGSPDDSQTPRSASHAPQRLAVTNHAHPSAKKSPLTPEEKRYVTEQRREDASIQRMNEQLRALIQQGRNALGTRVEVLDDDEEYLMDYGDI